MFPSTNIELLNFIREQFSERFKVLVISELGQKDFEFMESCFVIIYNLLKTGMEGLYLYNKYIYYGLIHEDAKVNQMTVRIIK